MMHTPQRRQLRPQFADVMRFDGWSNAQEIFDWCGKTFFVGRGYEHYLRRDSEYDRSNHHILDDAPPFLVLKISDHEKVRVDIGKWVVLGGSDGEDLGVMDQAELNALYPVIIPENADA